MKSNVDTAFVRNARILAFIMAGGKGERLYPLTHERAKPAVPFGGKYRLIDFALSNFVNSGVMSIYVLVRYMSQSLIEYLRLSWRLTGLTRDQFITVVPPQMRLGPSWYRGTADAVRQNLNLVRDHAPDVVAVFGADHVYRMDIRQMLRRHLEAGADLTVSAVRVPLRSATSLGVIETDPSGRITGFSEKPKRPKAAPGHPGQAFGSMGNYIFRPNILLEALEDSSWQDPELDFGHQVLPKLYPRVKAYAYDFSEHVLPGLEPGEDTAYWRDVGTLASYYQANLDLLGPSPKLNLDNERWRIHSGRYDGPAAKVLGGRLANAIIGDGCLIDGATLRNSILGRGVKVAPGAVIEDSLIMDFCRVGAKARVRRAVIDRFNEIAPGTEIGRDPAADASRYLVDPSGLVAIGRGRLKNLL